MAEQREDSWRGLIPGVAADASGGVDAAAGAGERMVFKGDGRWMPREIPPAPGRDGGGADRWAEEQLFEEDVRSVLMMMRPNRRERLLGWSEYRTGGAHFRATISWDEEFEVADAGRGRTRVPSMADVLEAVLVGSARHDDDLTAAEEFEIYREVVRELYRRLNDLQACYE